MTIKLISTDLYEVSEKFPIHTFSMDNKVAENRYLMDNCNGKATITELRTCHYCMSDATIRCYKDCTLFSETDNSNVFWLCAILCGNNKHLQHYKQKDEIWLTGQVNLLAYRDFRMNDFYENNKSLRVVHVMLSAEYMERLVNCYPYLFETVINHLLSKGSFRLFARNMMFCPEVKSILNNMFNYKMAGNAAALYLDAKIQEILSLLMCQSTQRDCSAYTCYSKRDNDKLFHAKAIIEQEYRNPPSLHQLAIIAGTNTCKLKIGFKALFGATVFEYLFNYRMELACRHLLDTEKSIQEIAEVIGYEYHSHFSTAFKRKFGLSPMEYRKVRLRKL